MFPFLFEVIITGIHQPVTAKDAKREHNSKDADTEEDQQVGTEKESTT